MTDPMKAKCMPAPSEVDGETEQFLTQAGPAILLQADGCYACRKPIALIESEQEWLAEHGDRTAREYLAIGPGLGPWSVCRPGRDPVGRCRELVHLRMREVRRALDEGLRPVEVGGEPPEGPQPVQESPRTHPHCPDLDAEQR